VSLFVFRGRRDIGEVAIKLHNDFRGRGGIWWTLFVAGAVFQWKLELLPEREMLYFSIEKCAWRARKVTSVVGRVADWRVHGRIILWSWSDHTRIITGSDACCRWFFQPLSVWSLVLRGTHSIWWCWRVTRVAPCKTLAVSCVATTMKHECCSVPLCFASQRLLCAI